jgi:hypothetical protein
MILHSTIRSRLDPSAALSLALPPFGCRFYSRLPYYFTAQCSFQSIMRSTGTASGAFSFPLMNRILLKNTRYFTILFIYSVSLWPLCMHREFAESQRLCRTQVNEHGEVTDRCFDRHIVENPEYFMPSRVGDRRRSGTATI